MYFTYEAILPCGNWFPQSILSQRPEEASPQVSPQKSDQENRRGFPQDVPVSVALHPHRSGEPPRPLHVGCPRPVYPGCAAAATLALSPVSYETRPVDASSGVVRRGHLFYLCLWMARSISCLSLSIAQGHTTRLPSAVLASSSTVISSSAGNFDKAGSVLVRARSASLRFAFETGGKMTS